MGDKTNIAWTDATMNAIRGCQRVSSGCDNCYAMTLAYRYSGPGLPYEGLARKDEDGKADWTGAVKLIPEKLLDPLRWQRPRRIFVNSMSDLFYARVPLSFVDQHFATFALASRHQFQVLTKRPERMARYTNDPETPARVLRAMHALRLRAKLPKMAIETRPIPGFDGYFATTEGVILSGKNGDVRPLSPDDNNEEGRQRVTLFREGVRLRESVHRLVLATFVREGEAGEQGRHLDGNAANNRLDNLLWGTQGDNWADRIAHGNGRSWSKLTEAQVAHIRQRADLGEPAARIAPDFGISDTQVRNIVKGAQWKIAPGLDWPLKNCWLGTSVEGDAVAGRIDDLRTCDAAVRFLSCEPLIAPLNLTGRLDGIHWVIVGGESGPGYRPLDLDWVRAIRDTCAAAGLPMFFKQGSGLKPGHDCLLDGQEHKAFPAALEGAA